MKKLTTLICFGLCFYFQSHGQELKYVSTIDIVTKTENTEITKEHELIVIQENNRYVIEFNIKHGRKIKKHRASVVSDKLFNKASFNWESDNKVAVRLFNMDSEDEFELKVWGDKTSTGMEVETEESSLHTQDIKKFTLDEHLFKIEFNTTWTFEDIFSVRQELKSHNIELNYTLLQFDDNGFLKRISASIDYKDGKRATFESRELTSSDGPGFRRDLDKFPIGQD